MNGQGFDLQNTAEITIVVNSQFWQSTWFYLLFVIGLVALLLVINYTKWRYEYSKRLHQQEYSRQLIAAHESERKRIAAELQDSLGHNLMIIKNWATLAITKYDRGTDIIPDLKDISETASIALDETRSISGNLLPLHLQRFGLTSALNHMIKVAGDSSTINITGKIDNIDGYYDAEGELSIFRIVQEALSNISRHSEASNASVIVRLYTSSINIKIRDDGKGFNTRHYSSPSAAIISFGINNIRERTELLGGTYSLQSEIGSGSKITITLPARINERK